MDTNYIRTLYEFNVWANERTFEAVSKPPAEQLTKNLGNSFGSIHDTLVHLVSAEWMWLTRWKGTSPKAMPDPKELSTLDALRARLSQVESDRAAFLKTLTDAALATPITYSNFEGKHFTYPLWQPMAHLVNHSSYHRGQVTTMLRQLGAKALATDMLIYLGVKSGQIKL